MKRRAFLAAFAATAFGSTIARAQQPSNKIPLIGILSPAENEATLVFEAFRQGLRELGYVEGRNIILEYRFAHGDSAALPRLAEELANLPVDVIVADTTASTRAAAGTAPTIPIVMGAGIADPAALGLAHSLARPGGNVTGFTVMSPELSAKRVDLIRTALPDARAVTVLVNRRTSVMPRQIYVLRKKPRVRSGSPSPGSRQQPRRPCARSARRPSVEAAARFSCCRTGCSGTIAGRSSHWPQRRASPPSTPSGNTRMMAV
jgi:ABC-type uncharacterized transport system substrate-binding protein